MYKEMSELFYLFSNIRSKGWIKSMRNGPTGVGYKFEYLIGKKENHLALLDFKGIEIKSMRLFSNRKIHLFN